MIGSLFEDSRAAVLWLFLVFGAVLNHFFALLVGLVLVVVAVHTFALVLVDVLDDVVNDVPFACHLLRLDLSFLRISSPGPVLVPVWDHTKHEVLLRRLVILHLALFEYLLVLELIVSVHDAVCAAHHDIGLGHALALHYVVRIVVLVIIVALLSLIYIVEIVHARRATWCPHATWSIVFPSALLSPVIATRAAPASLRRRVSSFFHIAGAAVGTIKLCSYPLLSA